VRQPHDVRFNLRSTWSVGLTTSEVLSLMVCAVGVKVIVEACSCSDGGKIFRAATLHDELSGLIRAMIVGGELCPGQRISEQDLCARFGVSRTPLREALKVLSVERARAPAAKPRRDRPSASLARRRTILSPCSEFLKRSLAS